jgi:hypothetical protein
VKRTERRIEAGAKALYDAQNFMRLSQPDEQDRIIVPGSVPWEEVVEHVPALAARIRRLAGLVIEAADAVLD